MLKGINPRVWLVILSVIMAVVWLAPLAAMAATGPAGTWIGEIETPDGDVEIVLTLDDSGGNWTATIEDEFMGHVEATNVNVSSTQVMFTFQPGGAPFPAHFTGFYSAGDDKVTGTISQRGTSRFIKFQRDLTSTIGAEPLAPGQEPEIPAPIRHDFKFAVTGRLSHWFAMHLVKDENYNINNLTSGHTGFDLAVKYFPLDGFNIFVRGFRGGQGTATDPEKLARFAGLGINADSFIPLSGVEFGVMGYFGNIMMRESNHNPYLTAAVGTFNWEVTESGRGTRIIDILDDPLKGTGLCAALGLGTEYKINDSLNAEIDFLWRYFKTQDELVWEDPDNFWSNTHTWAISLGLTYGFF